MPSLRTSGDKPGHPFHGNQWTDPLYGEAHGQHTPAAQQRLISYLEHATGERFRAHGSVSRGETSTNDFDLIRQPMTAEEEDAAIEAGHRAESEIWDKVSSGELTREQAMEQMYGDAPDPLGDALRAIGFELDSGVHFDLTPTGTFGDPEVGVTRFKHKTTGHTIEIWESLLAAPRMITTLAARHPVVAAADAQQKALETALLVAFARARRKLPNVEAALRTLEVTLLALLPIPLQRAYAGGGMAALSVAPLQPRVLRRRPIVSALDMVFGVDDPYMADWGKRRSASLVTRILASTRQAIRSVIAKLLGVGQGSGGTSLDRQRQAHDAIAKIVGDETRAQLIARTETMIAANEGQRAAWDQAVKAGLLPSEPLRMWIVTDDDHLCPQCEPMSGQTAPLHGVYSNGSAGPPLHPNCRCTEGIA